jgi:diguanylate cyclase (GGDEF)-like protein
MVRAKFLLLAIIMCTFLGVTIWSTWNYDRAFNQVTRHTHLSAWALAQLELELHEFEGAVDYYRAGRISQDKLNQAYDLAWNRLDIFLTGSESKSIRERFHAEGILRAFFVRLQSYESLLTSPHLQPTDLEPLDQDLHNAMPAIRNLMVLNFTGPTAMRENAELDRSKTQNYAILGVLLLVGLVMLVLLFAEARGQQFLAWNDPLTHLPNRAAFLQRLQQLVTGDQIQVVLCLFDLNRFKEVNDSLGHAAGDRLLLAVADKLREAISDGVYLAHIGGDEFALVLIGSKTESSWFGFTKRIRSQLESLLYKADPAHRVSVSMGVSQFPQHARNADELLLFADLALTAARHDVHHHYQLFNRQMFSHYQRKRQLAGELREQLSRVADSQLFLCYQPVVKRHDQERLGAELLIRWNHAELGFINPLDIVEAAEENGLGERLGEWVFQRMNHDLDGLPQPLVRRLDLAINLSASLFNKQLTEHALSWLLDGPLLPSQLILELTETIALDDFTMSQRIFAELRTAGIRIALDDFGTGWSSFAYLKELNFDKLKIDKSFIQKLDQDPRLPMFVETITELSHKLGVSVVAEGVETQIELDMVTAMQVDEIQGYFYARPLSIDKFQLFAVNYWGLEGPGALSVRAS